jgi:uncharacterized protein
VSILAAKNYMKGPLTRNKSNQQLLCSSLAGLSQGEFVTIPALPNNADWEIFGAARQGLLPNLSRNKAADRCRIPQRKTG